MIKTTPSPKKLRLDAQTLRQLDDVEISTSKGGKGNVRTIDCSTAAGASNC